jgi:hypothetical protein
MNDHNSPTHQPPAYDFDRDIELMRSGAPLQRHSVWPSRSAALALWVITLALPIVAALVSQR